MQKLSTTKITEGLTNENEISRLVGIMDTNSHEIFNQVWKSQKAKIKYINYKNL